ncbi:LysR family transcriptional regulator [Falsibacillus albus]|nr:LysR family transcriptional regulator [Falsibacillus albus]
MEQKYSVFLAVAEERSFSRAADSLFISQPAVSQYVAGLEKELGAALIIRDHKKLRLTKAGKILYEYVVELKQAHKEMNQKIQGILNIPAGELRIGASYTFGEYILPHTISILMEKFPNIHPTITIGNTTEIAAKLHDDQLDIGIVEGMNLHQDLTVIKLTEDEMYIAAGKDHSLAGKTRITAKELEHERWIIREKGSGTREATDQFLKSQGIKPLESMECGSTQIIKESVEAGLGISLISRWAIRKEYDMKLLRILNHKDTPVKRDFSIIRQSEKDSSKAIEVFQEVLLEYFL